MKINDFFNKEFFLLYLEYFNLIPLLNDFVKLRNKSHKKNEKI